VEKEFRMRGRFGWDSLCLGNFNLKWQMWYPSQNWWSVDHKFLMAGFFNYMIGDQVVCVGGWNLGFSARFSRNETLKIPLVWLSYMKRTTKYIK
jgi:hypothetical protein